MMSQKIIFLEGDNIFTSTKQEKIFGQNSPIKASKYIFAMGLCNEIKKDELEKVKALLSAHEITFAPNLIITPRLGTQSSWSSKAQDIFKNVGIKSVQRLETAINTVALARARAKFPQHIAGVLHHAIGPVPPREKSYGRTVWRAASRHAPPDALSVRCDPLKRLARDTHHLGDPDHELPPRLRFNPAIVTPSAIMARLLGR